MHYIKYYFDPERLLIIMKNVKVHYLPLKSMAEGMRMILAFGGQEFEDIRIPKDEWPESAHRMQFSQLPILEIDGQQFPHCVAATRFLGRQFKLAGADAKEDYNIDSIVEHCVDIFLRGGIVLYETDPEIKKKYHEMFNKDFYPSALTLLNKTIKENHGYLANGKLSWGDFFLTGMYDYMKLTLQMPDLGEKYPNIRALHDRIVGLPKVKAWAESAPQSDY